MGALVCDLSIISFGRISIQHDVSLSPLHHVYVSIASSDFETDLIRWPYVVTLLDQAITKSQALPTNN